MSPAKTGQIRKASLVTEAGEFGLRERGLWISQGAHPCPRLGAITSQVVKFARLSPYDAKAEYGCGPGLHSVVFWGVGHKRRRQVTTNRR